MAKNEEREPEFQEMHVKWVWAELHERFGFNVPEWKKRYYEELRKKPGREDSLHFFFVFMNTHVNPVLNQILCRRDGHPTFNKFTEYVVRRGRR